MTLEQTYHVFLSQDVAKHGGLQSITLKSGNTIKVRIPSNCFNGSDLSIKKNNIEIKLVTHSLFDTELEFDRVINEVLHRTEIKNQSQERCMKVYNLLKQEKYSEDIAALNLLDFVIVSAKVSPVVAETYSIASKNSRLLWLENSVKEKLHDSLLSQKEQKELIGIYQQVKAGDWIEDLNGLAKSDSLVQSVSIPEEIKQFYFQGSAACKVATTNWYIINLIETFIPPNENDVFISNYEKLRDGKGKLNQLIVNQLDRLILSSDIPEQCKVMYKLMRDGVVSASQSNQSKEETLNQVYETYKVVKKASKRAAGIVPNTTHIASAIGAKAGTGVAISGLSGAAATNSTLALLGGGSVAAGGLGMLGGLAVATGGAALFGAAALVSVASFTQMDAEDKKNLGIAAGVGVATSAATIWTAWTAVSVFGVASTGTAIGTLSGAAAYSATMAALGGVSVMTGGAAVVAAGVGLAVWKYTKGNKNNPKKILKQLEARLYE